jgi:hypothetical protein
MLFPHTFQLSIYAKKINYGKCMALYNLLSLQIITTVQTLIE